MSWLLTGRRVLVREPGPDITTTIQRLLDDGAATVVVETAEPTPELRDVVGRGLAELAAPGTASADVVVTDPVRSPAGPEQAGGTGRVVLVGGGPGDPGLLTLAGYEALRQADVVVTDRLGPLGALTDLPAHVEVVHVGKIPRGDFTPQERINAVLVERALAGQVVVRLKGGDGFVLGRGGEEWLACTEAGVPVEVVPGVSSAMAVPALAQIPVTHRGLSQGVVVVSGHVDPGDPRSEVDWAALAQSRLTLVVLMGVATLPAIASALVAHGLDAGTPAASIANGGTPRQQVVRAPLSEIAEAARAGGIAAPAVTVIGPSVAALDARPTGDVDGGLTGAAGLPPSSRVPLTDRQGVPAPDAQR